MPPGTIFTQTLIHDFDTLLWLNPGAEPLSVYATADALVAPDFKEAGLLDTAVVVITFDNGAIVVAEANFSAVYGYDVPRRGLRLGRHGDHGRRRRLLARPPRRLRPARRDRPGDVQPSAGHIGEFAESVDVVREACSRR